VRAGSWLSRRLAHTIRFGHFKQTHKFYVASASVLDVPCVRISLRLCEVWPVGRRALCGFVRESSIWQEVAYYS
jgi:hypothetical protein